jgi:endo-alpha-1,4-polygalactosaminidase (GH114 family)
MLIEHAAAEVAPADIDDLTTALTRTLGQGMGGPMSAADRELWQLNMIDDLQEIPGDLAIEALAKARQHCRRASEVLPFVIEYVEDYPARRRNRLAQLIQLADVAGVAID